MKPLYVPNVYSSYTNIEKLIETVPWVSVKGARKECFMSDVTRKYQYDGPQGHVYESVTFNDDVLKIMEHLNFMWGYRLNVCFLNYYENETKSLHWHSDDSHPIDHGNPICVISFGAEREIWTKPIGYKGEIPKEWRQKLGNGSVFTMPAGFQNDYLHRIPKGDREMGSRVSLTFRRYDD